MYSTSLTSKAFLPSVSIMGVYGTEYLRQYSICFFSVLQLWLLCCFMNRMIKLGAFLILSFPPPFFSHSTLQKWKDFLQFVLFWWGVIWKKERNLSGKWKCDYQAAFKNPLIISWLRRFLYCYFSVLKYIEFCCNLKFAFFFLKKEEPTQCRWSLMHIR